MLVVDNVSCASCRYIVEQTLPAMADVRRVEVPFKTKTAAVLFDDAATSVAAMAEATIQSGYPSKGTQ